MADDTKIEWADTTLNLWFGCTQLSPACDHCYAMTWGPRLGVSWNGPPKRAADSTFAKIAAYQRGAARFLASNGHPRRVFVNSLSDFFDNQAEQAWRDEACREFDAAPDVVWILVTKRPQNVSKMVPKHWLRAGGWPRNVWLTVTAENQQQYNLRVAALLAIVGPVIRCISMEPMLELIHPGYSISGANYDRAGWASLHLKRTVSMHDVGEISWLIIGGESGRHARSMPKPEAVADLAIQYSAARVAVFMKQVSEADFPGKAYKDSANFPKGTQRMRRHPA